MNKSLIDFVYELLQKLANSLFLLMRFAKKSSKTIRLRVKRKNSKKSHNFTPI